MDLCNAIVKKGDKRFICEKETGHARRGDLVHEQFLPDRPAERWTDSPMGGETAREL